MDEKTIKKRVKTIRQLTRAKKLDCLILSGPENVSFFTGFTGRDSWAVISRQKVKLITDSRYTEQAERECVNCRIIERKGTMAKAVAQVIGRSKSVQTAAIESRCSVSAFKELKKQLKIRLKAVTGIVESVRRTKDPGEVKAIRTAVKLAWQGLDKALAKVKAPMTESELAALLDFNIRKTGSANSFETIVAFGAGASCPHYQPTLRKLRTNDTILIDFGAKYKGYCCDMTRCFVVGKVNRFYQKAYTAVVQAQRAAIKMVRPGVKVAEVDAAARKVLAEFGLPQFGHGTGHGLGLEVHEMPVITDTAKDKLKAGDVVTIEPGVYIPGKIGIRIEDDVLITETGCRVLSEMDSFRFSRKDLPILKCR